MKKILLILCFCLPAVVFAQKANFTIKGKIANLNNPATVFLIYNGAINGKATLNNGEFEFNGQINQPTQAYLTINTKGTSYAYINIVNFYVEEGNITITCRDSSLDKAVITGTKTNAIENNYKALLKSIESRGEQLETMDTSATEAQKRSPEFLKKLEIQNKQLEAERKEVNKKYIIDNPSSVVSLEALYSYAMYSDYDGVKALYDKLAPEVKNSDAGIAYAKEVEKMSTVAIGKIAPDFELPDTNYQRVALSSFKGKYVLLDFWASWCPVCRESNPGVVKAYDHYKNKNFKVLSVSLDKQNDRKTWLNAIHHDGLTWTQVSDLKFWSSKVVGLYHLTGLRQNFLIDPDGKIIAHDLDGDQLSAKLAELFSK